MGGLMGVPDYPSADYPSTRLVGVPDQYPDYNLLEHFSPLVLLVSFILIIAPIARPSCLSSV
jgi:hypothetical protein